MAAQSADRVHLIKHASRMGKNSEDLQINSSQIQAGALSTNKCVTLVQNAVVSVSILASAMLKTSKGSHMRYMEHRAMIHHPFSEQSKKSGHSKYQKKCTPDKS